jgi:hypothetical protein
MEWRAPASNHDSLAVLIVIVSTARCTLHFREWDGPAVLPPLTALRVGGGLEARGDIVMSRKTDAVVARTIGIDTGKNTLNLIGLDDKGSDRFAREAHSRPDRGTACDSDQALRHIRENLVVSRRN